MMLKFFNVLSSVEKTAETFLAYWVAAMIETDEVMLVQLLA